MNLNLETLFNVKNKTAVVTGGSRGIGAMITEGFLANGCKVYITARKKEALEDKAKELTKKYNMKRYERFLYFKRDNIVLVVSAGDETVISLFWGLRK